MGTIPRRRVTGYGRRPQPASEGPQRSGGLARPSIVKRSDREEVPKERGKYLGVRVAWRGHKAIGHAHRAGDWCLAKASSHGSEYDFDGDDAEHGGCCFGSIRTISIRADVEILPNANKTAVAEPDCRDLIQRYEIGAG